MRFFLLFAGFALCLSTIYSNTLFTYYAHHDDYIYFMTDKDQVTLNPYVETELSNGRYLLGLFYSIFDPFVETIADLARLRLFVIFVLSICGAIIFSVINNYFRNSIYSFLFILTVFTLPPFEILVSWAHNASKSISLLFACLSFYWAARNSIPLAVTLFICALCTYPSGAMFYWFILFIHLAGQKPPFFAGIKQEKRFFIAGLGAIVAYAILVHFLKPWVGTLTNAIYNPYIHTTDIFGKIGWFAKEPLTNSLNLWNLFPKKTYTALSLALIFAGALKYLVSAKNEIKNILLFGIWGIIFLILTFLPNWVTSANVAFYRCSLALTPFVFFILTWSLLQIIAILPRNMLKNTTAIIFFIVCIYGSFLAFANTAHYRALPSGWEITFLKNQLKRADLYTFKKIHFILPAGKLYENVRRYDEFGVPSSHYRQDIPIMLKSALREIGLENFFWYWYERNGISIGKETDPLPTDKETLIIRFSEMYKN